MNILLQINEITEFFTFSDDNDLEEPIAEAALNIKYEIQESCKEKEQPLDPLADNFA